MKTFAIVFLLAIAVPLFSQDTGNSSPSVRIESISRYPNRTFVGFTINGVPASIRNIKFIVFDEDETFVYNGNFECTGNQLYDQVMIYDPGTYRIIVYDSNDRLLCQSKPIVLK